MVRRHQRHCLVEVRQVRGGPMTKRGKVLVEAINEAERFLRTAYAYKPGHYPHDDPRGRAAAKRASLDLTMALARMRGAGAESWSAD